MLQASPLLATGVAILRIEAEIVADDARQHFIHHLRPTLTFPDSSLHAFEEVLGHELFVSLFPSNLNWLICVLFLSIFWALHTPNLQIGCVASYFRGSVRMHELKVSTLNLNISLPWARRRPSHT